MRRWRCIVQGVDERMTVAEIAAKRRIQPSTWRSYVARGLAPQPDGHYDQRTPYWNASTIEAWLGPRRKSD